MNVTTVDGEETDGNGSCLCECSLAAERAATTQTRQPELCTKWFWKQNPSKMHYAQTIRSIQLPFYYYAECAMHGATCHCIHACMAKSKSKSVLSTCNLVSVFCTWCFVHAIANRLSALVRREAREAVHTCIHWIFVHVRPNCNTSNTKQLTSGIHEKKNKSIFVKIVEWMETRGEIYIKKTAHTKWNSESETHSFCAVRFAGQQRNERNQINREQKKLSLIIMNVSKPSHSLVSFNFVRMFDGRSGIAVSNIHL